MGAETYPSEYVRIYLHQGDGVGKNLRRDFVLVAEMTSGPSNRDGVHDPLRFGEALAVDRTTHRIAQREYDQNGAVDLRLDVLQRIHRIVKTLGMVNCTPDFPSHPKVINGFSELMGELLGSDLGIGARSAVGMMLPGGIAVEIEAIFQLK